MSQLSRHERRMLKAKKKREELARKEMEAKKKKKKKKLSVLVLAVVAVGLIAFFGLGLVKGLSESPQLKVSPEEFDFGQVSQSNGTVKTVFELSNTGKSDLVISNIVSSCMCTTAVLELNGKKSPVFGMHSSYANWSQKIKPNETAKLWVFYDPNVHPELKGEVTRTVSIYSNDPLFSKKEIKVTIYQTA